MATGGGLGGVERGRGQKGREGQGAGGGGRGGGVCALIPQSDSIQSENGFFNASISCFENAN